MLFRSSDVRERLPAFREMSHAFNDSVRAGAITDSDEEILPYADGMIPVGLNSEGKVVLPRSYRPENGPPVLMLNERETKRTLKLSSHPAEIRSGVQIIAQSGAPGLSIPEEYLNRSENLGEFDAIVKSSGLAITMPDCSAYELFMPRLLIIRPPDTEYRRDGKAEMLSHELDHWHFFLNEQGYLQSNPERRFTKDEIITIAERRAYGLSYRMAHNLGLFAALGEVDHFLKPYYGAAPEDMSAVLGNMRERLTDVGIKVRTNYVIARAIEEFFGQSSEIVTPEEVVAYRSLGLIANS